jgi:hypothetical protein
MLNDNACQLPLPVRQIAAAVAVLLVSYRGVWYCVNSAAAYIQLSLLIRVLQHFQLPMPLHPLILLLLLLRAAVQCCCSVTVSARTAAAAVLLL